MRSPVKLTEKGAQRRNNNNYGGWMWMLEVMGGNVALSPCGATCVLRMPTSRQPLVGTSSTPRTAIQTRAPSHSRAFCDSINMKALGASTFYPEIFKYLQRLMRHSAIPIITNIHGRQAASYHLQMHA
jgi:hypothetical protein